LRLERAWVATVWGAPFAMALVMFATQLGVAAIEVLVAVFWVAQLGVLAAAMLSTALSAERFKLATGVLLVGVLVLHLVRHFGGLHAPAAWGVSAGVLATAAWMLWQG